MSQQPESKSTGRKMFFAAFAATLVVLASAMVITVMAVQPSFTEEPEQSVPEYVYRPPAADTLTMVVIGERDDGSAEDFLLVRFNPQYGQMPLTLLPGSTLLSLDGAPVTLADAYQRGGGRAVKTALSEGFALAVDRYAVVAADAFVRVAAKTGTVVFELPRDLSYAREGYSVSLPAGERRLDGQDVVDLFACPILDADPLEKSRLLGDLTAAIINQNLDAATQEVSSGIFKLAINLIKTDLSAGDYETRRESADFLAGLNAQISGSIPFAGETGEGGALVPAESYVQLLRRYFQAI